KVDRPFVGWCRRAKQLGIESRIGDANHDTAETFPVHLVDATIYRLRHEQRNAEILAEPHLLRHHLVFVSDEERLRLLQTANVVEEATFKLGTVRKHRMQQYDRIAAPR